MITPPSPVPVVSVVTIAVRVPKALVDDVTSEILCSSVKSTSVKFIVPVSVRLSAGVTNSGTPPVTSATSTIGSSLVPVMVKVTNCSVTPPSESVMVMA